MIELSKVKLLAIDDDETIIDVLGMIFELNKDVVPNYELFTDKDKFLNALTPDVHLCLIDYFLGKTNGLDLINRVIKTNPYCWFIMASGQQDLKVIIEFMNHSNGTRYVEKGTPDFSRKIIYYIKDIMSRIVTIETYFYESYKQLVRFGKDVFRITKQH